MLIHSTFQRVMLQMCLVHNLLGSLFSTDDAAITNEDIACDQLVALAQPFSSVVSYVGQDSFKNQRKQGLLEDSKQRHADVLDMFFFQPVMDGRSASYTTFLGEQISFDVLVQPFSLKQAEFDLGSASFTSITAMSEGEPTSCSLSEIPFDVLSKNLIAWVGNEVTHRLTKPMSFDCIDIVIERCVCAEFTPNP